MANYPRARSEEIKFGDARICCRLRVLRPVVSKGTKNLIICEFRKSLPGGRKRTKNYEKIIEAPDTLDSRKVLLDGLSDPAIRFRERDDRDSLRKVSIGRRAR